MPDRSNPFDELDELFDRMSRTFEEAARGWGAAGEADVPGVGGFETFVGAGTTLDLADHDEEFVVTVDVPGYDSEDVDVSLTGETLHVEGSREEGVDEEEGRYIRRERRSESFSRSVRLPEPVDAGGVSAALKNGVLTITLPKERPGEDSHSIDIE